MVSKKRRVLERREFEMVPKWMKDAGKAKEDWYQKKEN